MNNYTIYFSFFGKEMMTTVKAKSKEEANEILKNKIVFHNIIEKKCSSKPQPIQSK